MACLSVWDIADLSLEIRTVGTTWVFRVKTGGPGGKDEFKACLCAQGFSQTEGVNYSKMFAPTGQLNSLCALISHAAFHDLQFGQLNVKTAFLNADLDEVVHLAILQGVPLNCCTQCLRLNKAIYGLKQGPLAWYNRLSQWLVSIGFAISICNPCVFFCSGSSPIWLFLHVDDLAVFGCNIDIFKAEISAKFDMKDLGAADLLLGIKIWHDNKAIMLSQSHSVLSLLDLYEMRQSPRLYLTHTLRQKQSRSPIVSKPLG
jgi:hypothetical protein